MFWSNLRKNSIEIPMEFYPIAVNDLKNIERAIDYCSDLIEPQKEITINQRATKSYFFRLITVKSRSHIEEVMVDRKWVNVLNIFVFKDKNHAMMFKMMGF